MVFVIISRFMSFFSMHKWKYYILHVEKALLHITYRGSFFCFCVTIKYDEHRVENKFTFLLLQKWCTKWNSILQYIGIIKYCRSEKKIPSKNEPWAFLSVVKLYPYYTIILQYIGKNVVQTVRQVEIVSRRSVRDLGTSFSFLFFSYFVSNEKKKMNPRRCVELVLAAYWDTFRNELNKSAFYGFFIFLYGYREIWIR